MKSQAPAALPRAREVIGLLLLLIQVAASANETPGHSILRIASSISEMIDSFENQNHPNPFKASEQRAGSIWMEDWNADLDQDPHPNLPSKSLQGHLTTDDASKACDL